MYVHTHTHTRTHTHIRRLVYCKGLCDSSIIALQHTATHSILPQHTATHCSTLQLTAKHCNTLQLSARASAIRQSTSTHTNVYTYRYKTHETDTFYIAYLLMSFVLHKQYRHLNICFPKGWEEAASVYVWGGRGFRRESSISRVSNLCLALCRHTATHSNLQEKLGVQLRSIELDTGGYGVATISRLLKIICLFAKYSLFGRALLHKRPIILRSILIEATS